MQRLIETDAQAREFLEAVRRYAVDQAGPPNARTFMMHALAGACADFVTWFDDEEALRERHHTDPGRHA